ncbi:amidohydrolase/deacetylase family metallohydrolase [Psychrobacillus psychrodurans]|uniref:amidohydrolase/deacetylase family metallohydrolase n=1 Tax=Psychrobacillus psychrodurans TaxID=126157 RepID=UPI001F4E5FA4|nr:amidohydrolase/deacetylase family metallohydrolase [Psychrobacillus psychrodurans]
MLEEIIIKNGIVIDPEQDTIEVKEIGVRDGLLVAPQDISSSNVKYIDAEGCYVSPGFIDMHVHIFTEHTELGIEADLVGIEQGVTTVVDAGSSGYSDYSTFKEKVIKPSRTEVLSFLNISRKGLTNGLSELANLEDLMSLGEAKEIFEKEPSIVGLKARMSGSVVKNRGIKPLEHARMVADHINVPIMVHIGNPPPNLEEIFPLLRRGDIVTHAFHGKKYGILNAEGLLIPEAMEALKKGILFDIGHGTDSFSYETLMKFRDKYDDSFTTSTDIYLKNYQNPVGSLVNTMSKLLELGIPLMEVVKTVTSRAARSLRASDIGSLALGTTADITIFKKIKQRTILTDSMGVELEASQILKPHMVLKDGKVVQL